LTRTSEAARGIQGLVWLLLSVVCWSANADRLRIATWNLNNLHSVVGEPLRPGAPARSAADFEILADYARRLNADVIALQEVSSPDAVAMLFPPSQYEIHLSGRYYADLSRQRQTDRIYTAFAVRRNRVDMISVEDVPSLGVTLGNGHRTRHGLELVVNWRGEPLHLLSVHLKSGCFAGALTRPRSTACRILSAQVPSLERWIDQRVAQGYALVVLGDFNRAFDVHGGRDHFWRDIDDREPTGLELWRLPFGTRSNCWRGTPRYHPDPIDFMVFDQRAWRWVDRNSFALIDYDDVDRDADRGTPSDHCPALVDLDSNLRQE